ncbi:hypothetical protein WJX79_004125 [Trebouxia sp. C0005]
MSQWAPHSLDRTRTTFPEDLRRVTPLQRSLSAGPRLQTQASDVADLAPFRLPHSYPSQRSNVSGADQGHAAAYQQTSQMSPGNSLLSTPLSSQLSFGSSPFSCTTRSSTPTSILDPPTTEKKRRTPPFTVYDAQPQNFKNPLFGTRASPSPQLAAYRGNSLAPLHRIDLESPACGPNMAQDHVPGQNNMTTPVANLSRDINAVASQQDASCDSSSQMDA